MSEGIPEQRLLLRDGIGGNDNRQQAARISQGKIERMNAMTDNRLFFNVAVDCEPLAAKSPQCGGPASWEVSETTICAIADVARELGMVSGFEFHSTPEAAKEHSSLLNDLCKEGFAMGVQPNVPGFRYPTYDRDLGNYGRDEQREILRLATEDWQAALGMTTTTYTACCGSCSDDTAELLHELGYREWRKASAGRYRPDRPDWVSYGMFPYPHHANRHHRLLAGDLDVLIVPCTGHPDYLGVDGQYTGRPADLRSERPVTEETRASYREIIDGNIERMLVCDVPVKLIEVGTHNTESVHVENLRYVCEYAHEAAQRSGLTFTLCSLAQLHKEADAMGGF